MFDHIGLKTKDIEASVRFYTAALAPLGYELCSRDESGAGFGPPGEPALWLYASPTSQGSVAHIAFQAPDRAAVDRFGGVEGRCAVHLAAEAELGVFVGARNAGLRLAQARQHLLGVVADGRDDAHPGDDHPPHVLLVRISLKRRA